MIVVLTGGTFTIGCLSAMWWFSHTFARDNQLLMERKKRIKEIKKRIRLGNCEYAQTTLCAICLEDMVDEEDEKEKEKETKEKKGERKDESVTTLICGHRYHNNCVSAWLQR